MRKQMRKTLPLDKDIIYRWFHLHCFTHIYKILTTKQPKTQFAYPRFKLFKAIKLQPKSQEDEQQKKGILTFTLFVRILLSFWRELIVGSLITIFFSCLNLLIPLMIKHFLHFMHSHHVDQQQITTTQLLIQGFILLQFMRIIFGEHSKRLFFQLAIKVESSLSLMIVKKSLTIEHSKREKISQSQILQLQNMDLKLVFVMFQNMYIGVQVPFTILVTVYLLYLQNYRYGLIGIYWFVIAFLLQRELDSRMALCNDTKLKLIEARSKINYHIIGKIRAAKLLGQQELLIQKNNDYFIAENHDHKMFYNYVTLYDITLIMLPILVIVTIALYDINTANHITVSQVYVLLSLLGICYGPMKNFRTLRLGLHDGMRSLRKIEVFLRQEDEPANKHLKLRYQNRTVNKLNKKITTKDKPTNEYTEFSFKKPLNHEQTQPFITISKHLIIEQPRNSTGHELNISLTENMHLNRGQRVILVGKMDSGVQTLFQSLLGLTSITFGEIIITQPIAFLSEEKFFRNTTVRENIRFYNSEITNEKIESVYKQLKLDEDLKLSGGLESSIDDDYKFNSVQLHKIALARSLCSNAEIYLLDKVFQPFNAADQILLEEILRQKQSEGKLIILMNYPNNLFQSDDKIIIVDKGTVVSFSTYREVVDDELFGKFYQLPASKEQILERQQSILSRLGSKLGSNLSISMSNLHALSQNIVLSKRQKERICDKYGDPILIFALHLWKQYKSKQHTKISTLSIRHYIWKFLTAVKPLEFICIFLVIAVAELMHIFIHFYIGHLQEEHGDNSYGKFRNMIVVEFVLTLGLAGIIWLQGQVSSQLAIIQGNCLYKNSLISLGQNKLSWFQKQYSVKIANRFNHDYQQVFIMLHMLLNIYKNVVILVATIYFLSESSKELILMTLFITATYMSVYFILRAVERRVVNYYEEYKYKYVKVLEESIGGAKHIKIHQANSKVIDNAKNAYLELASYKIAESYTSYGEEIFCDLVSLMIFSYVLDYGLQSKVEGNTKSIAEVATMIHLLIGVFDVLKTIVKDSVNFETFFKINLLPFVEIIREKSPETIKVQQIIANSQSEFELERSRQTLAMSQEKRRNSSEGKQQKNRELHCSPSLEGFITPHIPFQIHFNNVTLRESKYHEPVFEVYPLNIRIREGELILFYESNEYLKNYLLYGLTKNLPMFNNPEVMGLERSREEMSNKEKTIIIGGRDVCCFEKVQLEKIVQILVEHDFYIEGTVEDNLMWKNHSYDKQEVIGLADHFRLERQLPGWKKNGLKTEIIDPSKQLIKKLTFLRILSIKPKIIIIKDTQAIIENYLVVEQLRKFLGKITIIKISSNIDEAFDIDRIIYTKNFKLLEDSPKDEAFITPFSLIGEELRNANINGMLFANQMSVTIVDDEEKEKFEMSRRIVA